MDEEKAHFLEPEQFKRLRSLSTLRGIEGLFRAWAPVLLVAAAMAALEGSLLYYLALPFAWILIASRQHALAGIAHEAAHRLLFPNRRMNDWVGSALGAFPIGVSLTRYRAIHMEHHRKLGTDEDPDLAIYARYPIPGESLKRLVLRDLRGKSALKNLAYFIELPELILPKRNLPLRVPEHVPDMHAFWAYHVGLLAFMAGIGHLGDYLVLWWIPYFTILQGLLRVRGALEHGATASRQDPLQNSRTVVDHPLVVWLMAPLGLNYHLEHHLYPTIPWYKLGEVHRTLRKSRPAAQVSRGYRAAWQELVR